MGFIYKITNIISGKCYIGETKQLDPEKRWRRHVLSMKNNNGCPLIKNAFKKYGIDNFKFEILIICFDEDRFNYEKEYIKKYNSQAPNGYNILPGGEGGGFLGKSHTEESRKKISIQNKLFHIENPSYFETYRDKWDKGMKNVNISDAVHKSEKFQKAVKEERVGAKAHQNYKGMSDETKHKIRHSILKYHINSCNTSINIEKHREIMTNKLGRPVCQYTPENILINSFRSISEAGRLSGIKSNNIKSVLSGNTHKAGGFIWKYLDEKDLKA